MSKRIEIADRKMTTSAGLNALAELVEKLERKMVGDLANFKANKSFFCRVEEDNGLMTSDYNYASWTLTDAQYAYQDGYIRVQLDDDCHKAVYVGTGKGHTGQSMYPQRISKIDFAGAVSSLEDLVEQYNQMAMEKDAEIGRFLLLCDDFKN